MMRVHFLDVGQGNMTLLQLPGFNVLYDCNVTDDNYDRVIGYLRSCGGEIDLFINSHRDCDHFTGVAAVHAEIGIRHVWDCGITGSSPGEREYESYMRVRRDVGCSAPRNVGLSRPAIAGSGWVAWVLASGETDDPNCSSTVIRFAHNGTSVMLTGDSDAATWKYRIVPRLSMLLKSTVLHASHHGSMSFFDAPPPPASGSPCPPVRRRTLGITAPSPLLPEIAGLRLRQPVPGIVAPPPPERHSAFPVARRRVLVDSLRPRSYEAHVQLIRPVVTVVSVGAGNPHGHPKSDALALYERWTTGAPRGNAARLWRTDQLGTIVFEADSAEAWRIAPGG